MNMMKEFNPFAGLSRIPELFIEAAIAIGGLFPLESARGTTAPGSHDVFPHCKSLNLRFKDVGLVGLISDIQNFAEMGRLRDAGLAPRQGVTFMTNGPFSKLVERLYEYHQSFYDELTSRDKRTDTDNLVEAQIKGMRIMDQLSRAKNLTQAFMFLAAESEIYGSGSIDPRIVRAWEAGMGEDIAPQRSVAVRQLRVVEGNRNQR